MSTRVAVAGATGDMGLPVVEALLAAGFHVTGLTRQSSRNASKLPTHPRLVVAEVDYNSISSLKAALEDHLAVVSTLASTYVGEQNPLIDAAVAAGVKRFMPSEFGSNVLNPKRNKLPVFEGKVKTHEYLKTVATKNPGFTYTLICNSAFLDWGLNGFLINVPQHTANIYNGGDVPFSATNLATIGKAVTGVLRNLAETENRPIYIQDAVVTQNLLIQYAKDKDGVEWRVKHMSTERMYTDASAKIAQGITDWPTMQAFVFSSIFGEGYGQDFSDHLDNELLGLKGMTNDEVKALIESRVP